MTPTPLPPVPQASDAGVLVFIVIFGAFALGYQFLKRRESRLGDRTRR